jgi:hypothetical protein
MEEGGGMEIFKDGGKGDGVRFLIPAYPGGKHHQEGSQSLAS